MRSRSANLTVLVALALLALAAWRAGPFWPGETAALRPDTGTRAARLDDAALESVLAELLGRVYDAFGEGEEFAIYDGIATAVAPELVTDLYLQRRAAQIEEAKWGAPAEILDLDLGDIAVVARGDSGITVQAEWLVLGRVGHGDHTHQRNNAYAARLTLGRAGGAWRLTGFDLDAVERREIEEEPLFFEAAE